VGETVVAHVLGDGVGGRESDDVIAARGIGLADRGNGVAFSGSGLPVDDRKPPCPGRMAESVGLFAADAREFRPR
jgi:hypothetical protein